MTENRKKIVTACSAVVVVKCSKRFIKKKIELSMRNLYFSVPAQGKHVSAIFEWTEQHILNFYLQLVEFSKYGICDHSHFFWNLYFFSKFWSKSNVNRWSCFNYRDCYPVFISHSECTEKWKKNTLYAW